jgi:hypothetical protein
MCDVCRESGLGCASYFNVLLIMRLSWSTEPRDKPRALMDGLEPAGPLLLYVYDSAQQHVHVCKHDLCCMHLLCAV